MKIKKWIPFWVVPLLLIFAVATVGLRLSIINSTYSINEAEKQIRQLRQEKADAELKLASMRSPKRLESLAKTRFGLSAPRADQMIPMGPSPALSPQAPQ